MQVRGKTRGRREHSPFFNHLRNFALGQSRQHNLIALTGNLGDGLRKHLRTPYFDIAESADDHDLRVAQSARYKLEHLERGLIGFVQIVKNENQRLRSCRVP